jgi:hypothetical protein
MPVNMDPANKRRIRPSPPEADPPASEIEQTLPKQPIHFDEETEEDRVKELADAESKNLWEATEVIDMDKF